MNTSHTNVTNSFYTKFYPTLQSFTGSTIATLMIGKLEFWFENPKYKRGFYKFVEPCGSPLYRTGDSWSEELGVSRKLFAKAFDIVGVRYKSKSDYLSADDKFQGKLYASYHDRKTNRTYYVRNHEYVSQLLSGLFQKKKSVVPAKQKVTKKEENFSHKLPPKQTVSIPPQGRSRNGDVGRSYVRVSSYIHKKTSSLNGTDQKLTNSSEEQKKDFTEGMIKIWNEEVGELGTSRTKGLSTRLNKTLKELFGHSLEAWAEYCQMISSSKFLMGEAQNKFFKKAWITWAIKPENIDRIKEGAFQLGDRQTNQEKKISEIDREIIAVEYKKRHIEMQIENIRGIEKTKRKDLAKEKIKNLALEENMELEKEFEATLEKENNIMTEEFRKYRWKGLFISSYFDGFVREKIYSELFKTTDEENEALAIGSSGLLEILENVERELNQIKQKKKDFELKPLSSERMDLKQSAAQSCTLDDLVQGSLKPDNLAPDYLKPDNMELQDLKLDHPALDNPEIRPQLGFQKVGFLNQGALQGV